MHRKTYLTNRIQLYIFVSIIIVASIFLLADISTEHFEYSQRAAKIRQEFYQKQMNFIKEEVEKVYDMVQEEKSKMNQLIFETTKPLVIQANRVADHLYEKYKDTRPEAEVKQMIIDSMSPVRFFGGSQYYFIIDLNADAVLLNNQPNIDINRLKEYADPHGNYVLKDMVRIAKEQGEGFYTYYWTKPGQEGNNHKKSSYVKLFRPYNWIIGTGVYFEDYEDKLKKQLLERIGEIRFGYEKSGYIFVVDFHGTTLMNDTQRDLIGDNLWDMEDANGVKVIQEEYKAANTNDGDFIFYHWNNPRTGKVSEKASFVKGDKEWQWMMGAGFYYDNIEPDINRMHEEIYSDNRQEFSEYLIILSIIALFLLMIRRFFTHKLENDIKTLVKFFKRAAQEDEFIDTSDIRYKEFSDLAEYANKMLKERITAKNSLEQLNNELSERVEAEIRKNEKHVQVLHEQKKLADMGQMINAIAHQWRQPLNNIHLINQMLQDIDSGDAYKMDKKLLYQQHTDLVEYMSRTIDDFRNYFSVKKKKYDFSISDEINKTINLLLAQLNANNISVKLECLNGTGSDEKPDNFHGFAGEFRQIIMNLLSNAKDAIQDKRQQAGKKSEEFIIITVESTDKEIVIKVSNTGSPIPDEILSKIFNPYFTTKDEGKGTGIGLYLTKTIIEKEMNGSISVENSPEGVVFTITLRLN